MDLIIDVRKPAIPAGLIVLQKDVLGRLGHLILTPAYGEKNHHIYKECEEGVPAVPDDEEGEPLPFVDDEI